VLAAIVALAMLWIGPALITAVSYAAGSRVLARHPEEMIEAAVDVFRSASTTPEVVVPPLVVAVVVAALGLVGRLVVRRGRASAGSAVPEPERASADGAAAVSDPGRTPNE
jgi:hypothetical protein